MSVARSGIDLRFLLDFSRRLNQALDLERLLEVVRDGAITSAGAEACSLLLWNEERTRLEFYLAYNRIVTPGGELAVGPGEGLAGWVSEYRVPAVSNDVAKDPRFRHRIDRRIGFDTRNVLAVPLFRGSTVLGVLELLNRSKGGSFTSDDVRVIESLADQIAVALDNALLFRSLRREKAENEALYRIGLLLNERLELEEILQTVLDHAAEVVSFEASAFYLLHQDSGELEWFAQRGYAEGTDEQVRLKLGSGAVGWVANSGQPLLIPDVSREPRYLSARAETRSEIVVPVISESKVIGVLNLESDRVDAYRPGDQRVLESFANQAAISIQRAWFLRELRDKQRLENEMRFAREIQKLFLPDDPSDLNGYELAGLNLPSRAVSGDFYDYIRIADRQYGVMIGDVSGKGAPAALIMASLRASFRAEIRNRYAISEIMEKVNELLWESTEPERFATAVYGVLDEEAGVFTYANAGHNPPLLLAADRTELLTEGGPVLGPFTGSRYQEGRVRLASGNLLLFYTDGVTEALSPEGEEFGTARLTALARSVAAEPAAAICRRIVDAVHQHVGSEAVGDDVTLVVRKVL